MKVIQKSRKQRFFNFFSIILINLLLLGILSVQACGLSSLSILFKSAIVTNETSTGTRTFKIEHETENTQADGFIGYEIYYKLYKKAEIIDEINPIQEDRDFLTDSRTAQTPQSISGKDFKPLVKVKIENESFEIIAKTPFFRPDDLGNILYVDFSSSILLSSDTLDNISTVVEDQNDIKHYEAIAYNEDLSNVFFVHRYLDDETTKGFFSRYNTEDKDIKAMIDFENENADDGNDDNSDEGTFLAETFSIEVVLVAIPVGIDIANLQRIYGLIAVSEPQEISWFETP